MMGEISNLAPTTLTLAAIMVKVMNRDVVTERETRHEMIKFNLNVQAVFKSSGASGPLSSSMLRKSTVVGLFVARRDFECRCPKLKLNK